MEKIPAGGRGYLEADAGLQGVELEVGHRLNSTWRVGGYAARTWRGQLEAGARLRADW